MVNSTLRRLVRKPLSLVLVGVLAAIVIGGGLGMLVSEDFRYEVEARVAGVLPGTAIGGCQIKPGTQCPNADLRGATLYVADLRGANLQGAQLFGANLIRANLSGANLTGADLFEAKLHYADLTGANLRGARLGRAVTYKTIFHQTIMPDGSIRTD